MTPLFSWLFDTLDDRLGLRAPGRKTANKVFPHNWSFLLGEIALFAFVVLVLTGVFLTMFYRPSIDPVVYNGSFELYRGTEQPAAFESILRLSHDIPGGLLFRRIHRVAAHLFVAASVLHMLRILLTGAFRRPREVNYLVGIGLITFAFAAGFTGYSLPDDLLSGTGLRIAYSVLISVPFIGPYLAFLAFGGEFPTAGIISRLFVLHVMLLPGLIIAMIGAHLAILARQKHAQFPGGRSTESNVVGKPFWPTQVFKSLGLLLITGAVLSFMGGLIQINPVWEYGPFDPTVVSAPAQPDWYIGWLEGALRLFPPFDVTIFGMLIPSPFIPGVVMPGIAFGLMAVWPWVEARLTGDRDEHHLLNRPRDVPFRTGIGVAALLFFLILTLAGGNDVMAIMFNVPVEAVTNVLRVAVFVVPALGGLIAHRTAVQLQGAAPVPLGRTKRIRRNPQGGFEER
ncbi:MAG: cytochrome bc complex cytochrome b subunit [Actinobacteria bacterium]|nr:cytochrome bc complex cytochrome b subunit [Actinomycetota bacterium]